MMDAALLHAVAAEAARRLLEQEVEAVVPLGGFRYLLRFATPGHDALVVAVPADRPRLHLATRGPGRRTAVADRFAALLDREIGGARLLALDADPRDRRVTLRFRASSRAPGSGAETHVAEERTLEVALFGRGANALLRDAAGDVLGAARERPAGAQAERRDAGPAPPEPIPSASEPAAAAVVISERPLGDYREGDAPAPGDLRVALASSDTRARGALARDDPAGLEGRVVTRFESPSAAVAAACDLRERLDRFLTERARLFGQVRREKKRLESLRRRLEEDKDRLKDADKDRLRAEALLAGLRSARVEGATVIVPDPLSSEEETLRIPIDPSLPLTANAERLFERYKKGKRGRVAVEQRLTAAIRRLHEWTDLEARASEARSAADLESLVAAMEDRGLLAPPRRAGAGKAARQAPPQPSRVRRHETADGFVILVGRSGPENDLLTFKVASPWDFWLHAAGAPGAHVVVRNPRRLGVLPDNTLRTAAEIAAYYSGAKESGKVEVHVTQRKNVRKRKGAPPGEVLLKRFRSVRVTPRLPASSLDEI
jgi:predicted ribosome quality control (RQC) complex YloA/Tae2 family protein